jgi:NAD dependent epimerase/dehydratase family enzyme
MLVAGQRVVPTVLRHNGYTFADAELEPALRALLHKAA